METYESGQRNPVVSREKQISFHPQKENTTNKCKTVDVESMHFLGRNLIQELIARKLQTSTKGKNNSVKENVSTDCVMVTEPLSLKAKEHVATVMSSIAAPYATSQLNSNHLLLKAIKSNQ